MAPAGQPIPYQTDRKCELRVKRGGSSAAQGNFENSEALQWLNCMLLSSLELDIPEHILLHRANGVKPLSVIVGRYLRSKVEFLGEDDVIPGCRQPAATKLHGSCGSLPMQHSTTGGWP